MLRHLGELTAADCIEKALTDVYKAGEVRTRDLGGTASTTDFTNAICERMAKA
jgi:isocitrate dehydrogenase (NAD+)